MGVNNQLSLNLKFIKKNFKWDQGRYDEIVGKLQPWITKKVGFKKDQLHFMPVSGFSGVNVVDPDYSKHPFYKGPSLIKYLDDLPLIKRESGAPVRFCVSKIILVKFDLNFLL